MSAFFSKQTTHSALLSPLLASLSVLGLLSLMLVSPLDAAPVGAEGAASAAATGAVCGRSSYPEVFPGGEEDCAVDGSELFVISVASATRVAGAVCSSYPLVLLALEVLGVSAVGAVAELEAVPAAAEDEDEEVPGVSCEEAAGVSCGADGCGWLPFVMPNDASWAARGELDKIQESRFLSASVLTLKLCSALAPPAITEFQIFTDKPYSLLLRLVFWRTLFTFPCNR